MLQTSLKDEIAVKNLIKAISAALLIVALLGVIENYTGFNPSPMLGEKHKYAFERNRSFGSFDVTSTYLHRILFGAPY